MEYTAASLARLLQGTVEGDGNAKATRFAKIEHGTPGALCFFANPKYESYVYTTQCSILLVNKDFQPRLALTPTLVRVENAYEAVARLLQLEGERSRKARRHRSLRARWHCSTRFGKCVYVSDFAHIGRHTVIGDNTYIGEHVWIGDNCRIGKNCVLHAGVKIYPGMVIGDHVILHSGVVIGADGFGNTPQPDGSWRKIEHLGNVVIGNDVEIGANTTVDRAEMESTRIGNGVKIDNLCQIAHNVEIGDHTVMAAQVGIAGSVKIGRYCVIGGQVGFAGHITIADHTTIGAQSGILGSILQEGQTVWGSPAFDIKQYMRSYVRFKQSGKN